jgi:hypothetical protein
MDENDELTVLNNEEDDSKKINVFVKKVNINLIFRNLGIQFKISLLFMY